MYLRVGLCIKNLPIVGKASMSDISFEHVLSNQYTVFDGLAGMHVEDIYQDRQGFLWIATADGGVSRFDSARFDTFGLKDGLPNLTVMAIAEDADGRLLFGTFGGGLPRTTGAIFRCTPLSTACLPWWHALSGRNRRFAVGVSAGAAHLGGKCPDSRRR